MGAMIVLYSSLSLLKNGSSASLCACSKCNPPFARAPSHKTDMSRRCLDPSLWRSAWLVRGLVKEERSEDSKHCCCLNSRGGA